MDQSYAASYEVLPPALTETIMYGDPDGELTGARAPGAPGAPATGEEVVGRVLTLDEGQAVVAPPPMPKHHLPYAAAYETEPAAAAYETGGGIGRSGSSGSSESSALAFLMTGDLLEDCDNMLRVYVAESHAPSREKLFVQFWRAYERLQKEKPRDYLKIPCKVRGILAILPDFEPYRADEIMRTVLSRNGLLTEPEYIPGISHQHQPIKKKLEIFFFQPIKNKEIFLCFFFIFYFFFFNFFFCNQSKNFF